MKATTIIAGVVVTASVGYIGYRVYLAVSEQAKPIDEARALDPKDNPVIAEAPSTNVNEKPAKELPNKVKELPSKVLAPTFFGEVIRFKQPAEEPASFPAMIPLQMPFPTRSNFKVATMMDVVTPSKAVNTRYGNIMARDGETVEQAVTRYLNANPDVRRAHGL